MSTIRQKRYAWIGVLVAASMCACGLFSGASGPSISNGSSPATSLANSPSPASQNFPLTPDPINVTITLDTQHAVSNNSRVQAGVANIDQLSGTTANGTSFNFGVPDSLMTQEADGTFEPAFGTAVTVTPVSAIGGIPFSKGFVSAFQMAPEGLLMIQPGTFEMNIPGNYTDLVGFAANGDGTDFHLYPVMASPGGGFTIVTFNVYHFSLYGVAEATQSEITAQQAHPPSSPADQDDDLLVAPLSTKDILSQEHDRLLKSAQSRGTCTDVINTARNFIKWYGNVQSYGQQDYFKDTITTDSNALLIQLKDCLKDSCPLCLQNKKPDKASAQALILQASFVQTFDQLQNNAADANYYRDLANKCASNAGLPIPAPHVAECVGSTCQKVTPAALACPAP